MRNVDIVKGLRRDTTRDTGVGVQSKCTFCNQDALIRHRDDDGEPCRPYHLHQGDHYPCDNYDEEWRHIGEPLGFVFFSWLPRLRRNGRLGWLCWLERHYHPVHGDRKLIEPYVHTFTKSRVR